MPVPPGIANLITVNWFTFCEVHGLEYCFRCCFDFRSMNNQNVADQLEEEDSEELSDVSQPMF